MENLPASISLVFILTTILSVFLFYKATENSKITFFLLLAWLAVQVMLEKLGLLNRTNSLPPGLMIAVIPALLCIAMLFITKQGRQYLDRLDPKTLTLIHTLRIPVELVLFYLFLHKAVPEIMTFEGRNFDILAGLSAPFIFYFGYYKKPFRHRLILVWNFIALGLLLNIVIIAVLSAPFPIQQFGFEQPNIAVLHFPFNWLPTCVVPLVLLSHLAIIRLELKAKNKEE